MVEKIKKKCISEGLKDIRFYDEKEDVFIDFKEEYEKRGMKIRKINIKSFKNKIV